jgi:hypothetical protein
MRKMLAHTRPPLERYYACILLGRIAIGDWLTCAIGVVSLAILFRWKVSNPLLIARPRWYRWAFGFSDRFPRVMYWRFPTQSTKAIVFSSSTFRMRPRGMPVEVLCLPAQPVDATQALNLSAGVSNCKVSRGRSFS